MPRAYKSLYKRFNKIPTDRRAIVGFSVLIFAFIGAWYIIHSFASPNAASLEPENGLITAPAGHNTDSTASGGSYISFTSGNSCPSGECLPTASLPGWQQIFTDDFTTTVPIGSFPTSVSSTWQAYPFDKCWWTDTSKRGHYWPEKTTSISGGLLTQYLHTEQGPLCDGGVGPVIAVSAIAPKLPGASAGNGQLYGRYAVRFKADPLPRYKIAWLLWPDSETWPRDGEIDFPEGNLDGTIGAYMHRQNGASGSDQDAFATNATLSQWHTAVIEWSPDKVVFILDDQVIGQSTARVPNTPMRWVLQTETAIGGSAPTTSTAGNVYIDWVAVWKKM